MKLGKPNSAFFGPAILVTAAFIGPGTVLTASLAGAKYGYSLLWTVAFSVFATIVLQEMSARLGIVTGNGLSAAIKSTVQNRIVRINLLALILAAIFVGNSAYQTGNLLGAGAGWNAIHSTTDRSFDEHPTTEDVPDQNTSVSKVSWQVTMVIGLLAWSIIMFGKSQTLQSVMTGLVVLMSGFFLAAVFACRPELSDILRGLIPTIPTGSEWTIIGLIGTTVVPYNLFLHASAAAERWPDELVRKTINKERAIKVSSRECRRAIFVGGLITASILVTAAVVFHEPAGEAKAEAKILNNVSDVAQQLKPVLGSSAQWMFGIGLLAAGLTSAITAPIAAAYAAAGCFGWPNKLSDWRLKLTASVVMISGVLFAVLLGSSPEEAIVLAQVTNGLLLPIIVACLLLILNRVKLMHRFHNTVTNNVLGVAVLLVVFLIAAKQLLAVIL